jgi:hypothetical protein
MTKDPNGQCLPRDERIGSCFDVYLLKNINFMEEKDVRVLKPYLRSANITFPYLIFCYLT